jgi:RecB family exonuclease
MPVLDQALDRIARRRRADPLAPVTVIAPSHIAALQLRRRLATLGPFAGVRFETLPRISELIGAATLARDGRKPLARPIGDYVASRVARVSDGTLLNVRDLPGYGRVLRQTFHRLRRGGFADAADVPVELAYGHLAEARRLYGLFRQQTAAFYDEEDLLDTAASVLADGQDGFAAELGDVWVVPPGALSAGADRLLRALRRPAKSFSLIDEATAMAIEQPHFVLAPDPVSEAREVVREVIHALESGCGLHEVAVFHGADPAYRGLLSQAFESAGVPAVVMPGRPLIETPAGRGVLALAELPLHDFARAETLDFLNLAPLQPFLPAESGSVQRLTSAWQRLAREAGVTHGSERWQDGLDAFVRERDEALQSHDELSEGRRRLYETDRERAIDLRAFVTTLFARLDRLREPQPAHAFVTTFKAVVRDYLRADADALSEVEAEIDQLGTVDAVGGRFSLGSFAEALRANLTIAFRRERALGDGVLVADYRLAAGLSFKHTILCGAYEGVFPSGAAAEPLVPDDVWSRLRARHPFLEDARLRLQRSNEAAGRAIVSAMQAITWTAPLRDASGNADRYPSSQMLAAARQLDGAIDTASTLRSAASRDWLRRSPSPLSARLAGNPLDRAELQLRQTVQVRHDGIVLGPNHPLRPAVTLLRARRGAAFSEFDGNLGAFEATDALVPATPLSPTGLEGYATCGFRYFLGSVLRLRPVQEPEERDTMDPAERGNVVHHALDAFFREQLARGRPAPGEAWDEADAERLLGLLNAEVEAARRRGLTGLDVYAGFDHRTLQADIREFLQRDNEFRASTGAVPYAFEQRIPETQVGALRLSGFVDRVDLTPDGSAAWVIDYKTGSTYGFAKSGATDDPFAGGKKLQLPVYIYAAGGAEQVRALYWFISRKGEFEQIPYDASPENAIRFEATLNAIAHGLRTGAFPAVPGEDDEFHNSFVNCRYCDFDRICSLRRNYEYLDKQDDPNVSAWLDVGRVARGEAQP